MSGLLERKAIQIGYVVEFPDYIDAPSTRNKLKNLKKKKGTVIAKYKHHFVIEIKGKFCSIYTSFQYIDVALGIVQIINDKKMIKNDTLHMIK